MKRILVIDDEITVRKSCERALVPEGYDVSTASNGTEGLRLLEHEHFPLALLDLKMPDEDGIEILRTIKARWPETKVIMITGYSTVESAVQALRLGAVNYIEKPFLPTTLVAAVKEALEPAR